MIKTTNPKYDYCNRCGKETINGNCTKCNDIEADALEEFTDHCICGRPWIHFAKAKYPERGRCASLHCKINTKANKYERTSNI